MKTIINNLFVPTVFALGCIVGYFLDGVTLQLLELNDASIYVLYALMLQVGFSVGYSDNFAKILHTLRPKYLLIPLATVCGTLLFSAAVSLLLSHWSVAECLAVGSGMGYYSLSSILIVQLKTPSLGIQLATELGTIALLANIFRELFALVGAPLFRRFFGKLAPITVAGVTSVDVALPSIMRASGKEMIPIAIFHGILIDMSVPFFISFFCSL